jgi:hypothetical protein
MDTHRRASLANSLSSLRLTKSKRSRSSKSNINDSHNDRNQLGNLFFSLPAEIQSLILSHLPLPTIFSLRLTSRSALAIIHSNAPIITRAILSDTILPQHLQYIQTLYPSPSPCTSTNYLLQLLHRHHAIINTITIITRFIQHKIYMIPLTPRIEHFAPYREGVAAKLYGPAWTVWHYLESYRDILVNQHPSHSSSSNQTPGSSRFYPCAPCQTAMNELSAIYPAQAVLPAYHTYGLLLSHLQASVRAPAYFGSIERRLRGWSGKPPGEEELASLVVLGGVKCMANREFTVLKGGYNERLEVVGDFMARVGMVVDGEEGKRKGKSRGKAKAPMKAGKDRKESEVPRPGRRDVMTQIGTPFEKVTAETIEVMPHLDEFLVGEFQRRILEENLLGKVLNSEQGEDVESDESESDSDSEGSESDDDSGGHGYSAQQQQPPDVDESELEMLRQRELQNPFVWVHRLMGEIDEERMEVVAGAEGVGAM